MCIVSARTCLWQVGLQAASRLGGGEVEGEVRTAVNHGFIMTQSKSARPCYFVVVTLHYFFPEWHFGHVFTGPAASPAWERRKWQPWQLSSLERL